MPVVMSSETRDSIRREKNPQSFQREMQPMTGEFDPKSHQWARHEHVVVFDGVCNWCHTWVSFLIDHDPHEKFKFGTLQSDQGQQILHTLQLPTEDFSTVLLLEQARVY